MTTSHGQYGVPSSIISEEQEFVSNERALLEAGSRHRHKLKLKYTEDPSGVSALTYTRPMLALKYTEHRHKVNWLRACAQPKLDGVRCVVERLDDDVIRYSSRNGTPFIGFDYLTPELLTMMDPGELWDAEFFNPALSLQEIVSLVRRSKKMKPEETAALIQLHVFDQITDGTFEDRYSDLKARLVPSQSIRLVPAFLVDSEERCDALLTELLEAGYEGLMLRGLDSAYLPEYRSVALLKYKLMVEEEFTITGYTRGKGKDKNIPIFTCAIDDSDKTFTVRMEGSYKDNEERLLIAESLLGKKMTVRFQEYTPYGVPEFPVGVVIRDYE